MRALGFLPAVCVIALAACGFEHGEGSPDGPPSSNITVSFDRDATMVDEAFGTVSLSIVLSGVAAIPVSVDYSVSDGTAEQPSDFVLADGTLTFQPGETRQAITVAITPDTLEEVDETIVVTLSQPVGATLGATVNHTVTISANELARVSFADGAPTTAVEATNTQVELVLSIAPKSPVTVELAVAGTATPGADIALTTVQTITFQPNVTSQLVSLGVVQDALDEFDESVELALQNPSTGLLLASTNTTKTHTITDDDPLPTVAFSATTSSTNENQSINLTVQLSAVSGRNVAVSYAVTGGSATGSDATVFGAPGMLTFTPGQTSKTIAITVVDDVIDETNETLTVTLSSPVNATLGADTNTLTIVDNDSPPQVTFMTAAANVTEGAVTATLTVQLSAASSFPVTVPFAVDAASTAGNPADYTLGTTSALLIPAGMTSATIDVDVKADTLDEANETVVVDLGAPTNASLGAIATETLTINDDDPTPTVQFTSSVASSDEASTTITVSVQLSAISGQTVTVPFTINAGSTAVSPADYTTTMTSPITIPAGTQNVSFSITLNEDLLDEDDETITIDLGVPTNATLGANASLTFTITDDDPLPRVSWDTNEVDSSGAEGSAPPGPGTRTVVFHLVLDAPSGRQVEVPIVYTGTATKDTDYFAPDSITIDAGVTSVSVTLTIVKDLIKETGANETIIMSIPSAGIINAQRQNPTQRIYSLVDDD